MHERKKPNPLSRKEFRFLLKSTLIVSLIFILYQLIIFKQLTKISKEKPNPNLIRGTHEKQLQFYTPNGENQFKCIVSMELISFDYINDDYCDCEDGTDEPGTNACSNGQFFCDLQVNYMGYPKVIQSSKVNDGICDCCDGSDEWIKKELPFKMSNKLQQLLRRYQSPCPVLCD